MADTIEKTRESADDLRRNPADDARLCRRDDEIRLGVDGLQSGGARARDGHGLRSGSWRSAFRFVATYRRRPQPARMEFDDPVPIGARGARTSNRPVSSSIRTRATFGFRARPRRRANRPAPPFQRSAGASFGCTRACIASVAPGATVLVPAPAAARSRPCSRLRKRSGASSGRPRSPRCLRPSHRRLRSPASPSC